MPAPASTEVSLDRVPPQSIEAEMSVLGSMIINPECVGEVIENIEGEVFYKHGHRLIFQAIVDLFLANVPPDVVAVREALSKTGKLKEAGGYEYLATLVESVPNAANAVHYAKIIRDKAILRSLIQTCTTIIREASETGEDADKLMDEAQSRIFTIAAERGPQQVVRLGDILKETFQKISDIHNRQARIMGVSTGFHDLDDALSGLQPGQLYIIAGRPSMGKTSLGFRIVEHVSLVEKIPSLFFSLEMAAGQIAQTMLCAHCKVDSNKLRSGMVTEEDYQRLLIGAGLLDEAPIYIDDSADLSILELRARARRMQAEHKIGLVVVDYLQKVSARVGRNEGREREISVISSQLKSLSKELKVPVITLAQLNRGPESRDGRRPMLSDLRESGSIEQDADVVMLLYREDYYNPDTEKKNICEVNITKNRTGPTRALDFAFLKEYSRFESLSQGLAQ